ncbi:MAG: hypothetical protein AB7F98_04980 [Novosphingobium sp.]
MSGQLPQGFDALEPFIERWAIRTTRERDAARGESSFADLQAYYDAAQPLLGPALAYLDTLPVKQLAGSDQRLMDMMLSLAHVSPAVEIHKEMEPAHAIARQAMLITRSTTDPA